jgi:hypothetical protein
VPTTTAAPVAVERWTLVTDEGLPLLGYDALTEDEAREAAEPSVRAWGDTPVVALPSSVAREVSRRRRTIEETHEAAKRAERRLALAAIREAHGV